MYIRTKQTILIVFLTLTALLLFQATAFAGSNKAALNTIFQLDKDASTLRANAQSKRAQADKLLNSVDADDGSTTDEEDAPDNENSAARENTPTEDTDELPSGDDPVLGMAESLYKEAENYDLQATQKENKASKLRKATLPKLSKKPLAAALLNQAQKARKDANNLRATASSQTEKAEGLRKQAAALDAKILKLEKKAISLVS